MKRILITGGAGYVGSLLVPALLKRDYEVVVYDTYYFGYRFPYHINLTQIRGDIRNKNLLCRTGKYCDALIHLACLSNDPSCDLNLGMTREINYQAFNNVIECYKLNNMERLVHASSSTLFGFQNTANLTEESKLNPITNYGIYKAGCERLLGKTKGVNYVVVRPGTINGYAPRMRFDLVVNMFTAQAIEWHKIKIFGGKQSRPILNIHDMIRAYIMFLEISNDKINGEIFNTISINKTVEEIAIDVSNMIGDCDLEYIEVIDERNYNLSNQKIKEKIGFEFKYSMEDSVMEIKNAYDNGLIRDCLSDTAYNNVNFLKGINLKCSH